MRWLVDVGWGDSFRIPLRAEAEGQQDGGFKTYRITQADSGERRQLWERHTRGDWERQYAFTFQPHEFAEFEPMCHYHQTSPQSIFTREQICTLATPDGRITLKDNLLITSRRGSRQERPVALEEKDGLLRELFGIDLRLKS